MIAMNEEANLPRTLESVRWADEIVVVDSGSKDRTIEIAQSFGAKTIFHAFGGHGEQKNVALDLCTSDWTLLLDADEVLTPELQDEIRTLLAESRNSAPTGFPDSISTSAVGFAMAASIPITSSASFDAAPHG